MPQVPDVPLDGLYGDLIIEHYRNPRHRHSVPDPDVEAEEFNPFCGDRVVVQLKLDGSGCISQIGASAEGCSIIQASTSMMAEALAGKTLDELEALAERFRSVMQGRLSGSKAGESLGDLESLTVVRQYPVRIKCALLPWTALEEGIDDYRSSQARDQ